MPPRLSERAGLINLRILT